MARAANPEIVVVLDYPVTPRQRWTLDKPHPILYNILNEGRETYKDVLESFLSIEKSLTSVDKSPTGSESDKQPYWANEWIPPLDAASLYSFIATRRPKTYMEVGSGNSTKFARKAIEDLGLDTKIISIDPEPRAEIDDLCDQIIRKPIEDVDLPIFEILGEDDILFVDSSHRSFMNSDVTALFIDVLPRLRSGVLVQIHDILLPYDYPSDWAGRWYSEQYLLAALLLARGRAFETILPNMFISHDEELRSILAPLWKRTKMEINEIFGYSFWLKTL